MIMNEYYLVAFEQKLVRKEIATWDWNVWIFFLLASKCVKKFEKNINRLQNEFDWRKNNK
jgi:hypothetical protein